MSSWCKDDNLKSEKMDVLENEWYQVERGAVPGVIFLRVSQV